MITGQGIAVGIVIGALASSAIWTATLHHDSGGDDKTSTSTSLASVTACTPGDALDMKIRLTNSGTEVVSYALQADWYASDGNSILSKQYTSDPIEPGSSITFRAGNPNDHTDWKPGIRCYAKVTGTQ